MKLSVKFTVKFTVNKIKDRYVTSSKAGKKRKADIQKAQEQYEEKKRNKRLQAALTDSMRALPASQETFEIHQPNIDPLVLMYDSFRRNAIFIKIEMFLGGI